MKAYIYIRFSDPRQERGSSRERQLQLCLAMCERRGWEVVQIIEDLGRSAWNGNHLKVGNLGKFADRVFAGDIPAGSVLVVEELDRLSRQEARKAQRWIEDVCDTGLEIATVVGERIYSKANLNDNLFAIFEILMRAQAAYEYVERLSRRIKRSYQSRLEAARTQGNAITTQGPMWLKPIGTLPDITWVPIPERLKVIAEILDLIRAGHAAWAVARMLNERGIPSFTGRTWDRTTVVKIVRSSALEGDRAVGEGKNSRPTGEVLVGYYGDPHLPLDVISEARAMLNRRRGGKGRNSGVVNNLFGLKIRCGCCGGRMMLNGYQSRYLVCYDASRGSGCTNKATYRYREFEAAALDNILSLALDESFFRQADKTHMLGLEIATVEKTVKDKQSAIERLLDVLSRISSPSTETRIASLEAEKADLLAKLDVLNAKQTAAKGVATAEAHLARVHGVREALIHPDPEARLPARLRVSEALGQIVDKVLCNVVDGRKELVLRVLNGLAVWRFDNDGNLLGSRDVVSEFEAMSMEEARALVAELGPQQVPPILIAYLKRRGGPTGEVLSGQSA